MSLPAWNDGCYIRDLQVSSTDPMIFNVSKKVEDATFQYEQLLALEPSFFPFHTFLLRKPPSLIITMVACGFHTALKMTF